MNRHQNSTNPVLLIDDEQQSLLGASLILRSSGLEDVVTFSDSRMVMPFLSENKASAIVLDLSMPFVTGAELLKMLRDEHPDIPVIVMTAMNELETAVDCMKSGAMDYLVKPVDKERFVTAVKNALEMNTLRNEMFSIKQHLLDRGDALHEAFSKMQTTNRRMLNIFSYIEAVAVSEQPLLITGETGVGKELVAHQAHALSGRCGEFIAVNIAGLDETAFSDTLFGHVRGAFTGAESVREGMIAKAKNGTLFLDEIGDLKGPLQIKLLRLLEERKYFPLGSDTGSRCEARIIVATNHDLQADMASGKFRKDLYFRLRCHHLHIPPLRERREDIQLLLDRFLDEASQVFCKKRPHLPAELLPLLNAYTFPGNVREFKTMVWDAVARHTHGTLSLESFREHMGYVMSDAEVFSASDSAARSYFQDLEERLPTLKEAEEFLIAEGLKRADGNQGIAAAMLGITRQALNKRLYRKKQ
ncbi:MAG: sigma-54-dependent Fis family transcriptional regulator [Nitrospirae bacterium]|nr:MAG: sigma-54-dependent Fis family transcriptional regulator [Nitrospirota bacterium]